MWLATTNMQLQLFKYVYLCLCTLWFYIFIDFLKHFKIIATYTIWNVKICKYIIDFIRVIVFVSRKGNLI